MFSKFMSLAWLALAAAVVFAATVLVDNYTSQPRADEQELRMYAVPEGRADELRRALQSVLGGTEVKNENGWANMVGQQAKVTVYNNQLLVTAPTSLHWSLRAIVEKLSEAPALSPAKTNTYDVWFVEASQAKDAVMGAGLQGISQVLNAVGQEIGSNRFKLVDHSQLTSSIAAHEPIRRMDGNVMNVNIERAGGGVRVHAGLDADRVQAVLTPQDDKIYVLGVLAKRDRAVNSDAAPTRLLVLFRARSEGAPKEGTPKEGAPKA